MPLNYSQMIEEAVRLELDGDYAGALRIWRATLGAFSVTSTSKEGLTVTYSESMRREKIAQLENQINRDAGHGKVKQIPFEKIRVNATASTVYDADGYAWGY